MLDDYKDVQAVAYNVMMNEIKNNQVSHAYLIDENNNREAFDIVKAFVKEILTNNLDDGSKEILCRKIDDDNYPEIKIVTPDGLLIKKQQILDLQLDFSRRAIEGSKRIYIIRDADKMRSETANSMLKFLEEPDNDVVAILMTNNFNNLLTTIISRCQVIRLTNDSGKSVNDEIDELVVNFVKKLENMGIKAIIDEQELLFNEIPVKERSKFITFFDKMIDMYYDIMKISAGIEQIKYLNYGNIFRKIADKNTEIMLLNKINYLILVKDKIKNNVNMNLLIDSVIVKFGGRNESSWS